MGGSVGGPNVNEDTIMLMTKETKQNVFNQIVFINLQNYTPTYSVTMENKRSHHLTGSPITVAEKNLETLRRQSNRSYFTELGIQ